MELLQTALIVYIGGILLFRAIILVVAGRRAAVRRTELKRSLGLPVSLEHRPTTLDGYDSQEASTPDVKRYCGADYGYSWEQPPLTPEAIEAEIAYSRDDFVDHHYKQSYMWPLALAVVLPLVVMSGLAMISIGIGEGVDRLQAYLQTRR